MGKQPLKRFTIAITGYFGEKRSFEQMRNWIHANGGTFAYDVSPEVTHLVCSKDHFKKSVAIVKCAADTKEKKRAARKENIRKGMEKFEKGCQEFKDDMFSDGYHIYQDCTKFNHDVTLARTNLLVNKNDRFALKVCCPSSPTYTPPHKRHLTPNPIITTPIFPIIPLSPRARARIHCPRAQRLQLYESHATPKYYACYAKYRSPGHAPTSEMLTPIGSSWETAWDAFRDFFHLKTGTKWEERFVKTDIGSEAFTYTPPKAGQPRGMFLEI
ncbi:MAG: hypothetical protein Q9175_004517 [Cornicularia normoerica]